MNKGLQAFKQWRGVGGNDRRCLTKLMIFHSSNDISPGIAVNTLIDPGIVLKIPAPFQ